MLLILNPFVRGEGKAAKVLQGHLEGRGHEFQELAGARNAAVVHLKLDHLAGLR
jgi:hypothetical protein